ncbi:MAG: Penicillin-binding protein [Planctomycetota bacterium]|jgi:penicillin-binding protein 2
MRNSLLPAIFTGPESASQLLGPGSRWRLALLGSVFAIAAALILLRTARIQAGHSGAWLDALKVTSVEEEWLPARDGRILADSQVLAEDIDVAAVQVHYRWLQAEADPNWVRLQLRQRLTRDERRDPARVAAAERRLLDERRQLLQALADTTQIPLVELLARRDRIDARVQRVQQAVNARAQRQERLSAGAEDPADSAESEDSAGWILQWAAAVRTALTTPPRRNTEERIVVREEESWHTLLEDVDSTTAAVISEQPERFPGIRIVQTTRRTYPHPDTAVHLTGARTRTGSTGATSDGAVTADETAQATVAAGLRTGRFGVEKSYHSLLAGVPGLRRITRDRRQRVIRTEIVREPVSGRDVLLTINWKLQLTAEQLLAEALGDAEPTLLRRNTTAEQSSAAANGEAASPDEAPPEPPEPEHIPVGGAVVVMEAGTGRIAALASAPEFDLSLFSSGTTTQWEAVNSDVRRPFVSRFLAMSLPPGSTWKIATALAGMDAGVISPAERFECQGYLRTPQEHRCLTFRLFGHGHGPVTLQSALAQSCNVYFFDAAARMGAEPQAVWAERLGFGQPTGIDLPFESSGQVPRLRDQGSDGPATERERRRFEREALGLSIGQSRLTVTPLQLARLTACVANGGWLVTPHIASDDGRSVLLEDAGVTALPERRRVAGIDDEKLRAIREGLTAAVNDPSGTGYRTVRLPNVRIAGKTGTAEAAPGKPDHAWFAGWFPAEEPEYVVVAVLEHGGSGGRAAGPVAREIARSLFSTHPSEPHSVPVSQSPVRVRSTAF